MPCAPDVPWGSTAQWAPFSGALGAPGLPRARAQNRCDRLDPLDRFLRVPRRGRAVVRTKSGPCSACSQGAGHASDGRSHARARVHILPAACLTDREATSDGWFQSESESRTVGKKLGTDFGFPRIISMDSALSGNAEERWKWGRGPDLPGSERTVSEAARYSHGRSLFGKPETHGTTNKNTQIDGFSATSALDREVHLADGERSRAAGEARRMVCLLSALFARRMRVAEHGRDGFDRAGSRARDLDGDREPGDRHGDFRLRLRARR